ncbi:MAG: type I-E CRISPR-associated protein Cas5/CasD [Spiribacter salinus]|uniref:Type I-E CRISPR-associated protein Cas5/CasD n=1 Tax=Spiribacter salinus TaxID=1335746 RepID=A0A540VQJ9_9GAMM|nr:MAG: type I-E CRISPR-associated protein Cas5/CasD [Spiribacter salinus]
MDYLVFRLYGPFASWGEAAVGPTRPSASYPGRAAVIGLLGAALGIRRDDDVRQRSLRDSVQVAVKQISAGVLVRDYHTAQVPQKQPRVTYYTRRDELSQPRKRIHTILSSREYRCDGYWTVAVSLTGTDWQLSDLAEALRQPRFHLYLGRKACPLAAPVVPQIVTAAGIREALSSPFPALDGRSENDARQRLGAGTEVGYAWEGESGDLQPQETRYPYDEPLERGRWQFAARREYWHRTVEEA